VVSKKRSSSKFSARIISHVPKYFLTYPNLFQAGVPPYPVSYAYEAVGRSYMYYVNHHYF